MCSNAWSMNVILIKYKAVNMTVDIASGMDIGENKLYLYN